MRDGTITIDAGQLDQAAAALRGVHTSLRIAARGLDAVDVGVEMPAGLAGRVISEISSVGLSVARAADSLEPMPGDLRRRATLARIADGIALGQNGKLLLYLPAGLIEKFRDIELAAIDSGKLPPRAQAVGPRAGAAAKTLRRALEVGGHTAFGVDFLLRTAGDLQNPNLDTEHRVANAGARLGVYGTVEVAGSMLVQRAAAAAAGGAVGGPPGVAAAVALSVGWYVFDSKLHATDWVADRFVDGIDVVGSAARAAGDGIGDGAHAAGQAAESVARTAVDGAENAGRATVGAAEAVGDGVASGIDKAEDLIGGIL
jgi:hypothetical protein